MNRSDAIPDSDAERPLGERKSDAESDPKPRPRRLPSSPRLARLDAAELYTNRELSLLDFNRRVLERSRDNSVPLLERLKFLSISTTNLDEFFEIRVSGLKQRIVHDLAQTEADRVSPQETLQRVSELAHRLVAEQYSVLNDLLRPELEAAQIRVLTRTHWTSAMKTWHRAYFSREVLPVLTPVGLDPAHPFPEVLNKSLNFIVSLEGKDAFGRASRIAVVQAPRILPRIIAMPSNVASGPHDFVLLSSIIHHHVEELFPGMEVTGCHQFRVTRNSELWVEEEEVDDLLRALKGELPRRHFGDSVRLEVEVNCPPEMITFLLEQFGLGHEDLYPVNGPVNLGRLLALYDLVDRPDLKYPPFIPGLPRRLIKNPDLFEEIRRGDILLHHPFQSFTPVVDLVRRAARDPNVLALKQTLYRTGNDSPMGDALIDAALAGKEVTVVVELRARFDEAANIDLATRLKEAGAKVVYGVVGFKTHAKLLLIVRREGDSLRRYVHIGTGNYHTRTARAYTDIGLLTCDEEIGQDVHQVFQQLTGFGRVTRLKKLLQAPFTLQKTLVQLIDAEAANARKGLSARIIAKMNSLVDPLTIQALYRASQAGVQIDLIIRGICCLKPGIAGISENIRVRSIIGRFLEHTRIFHFHADGQGLTFCSSADWMPRNFYRRVEVCFPVTNPDLKDRVIAEGLNPYLADNTQAWLCQPDGSYILQRPGKDRPVCAQDRLILLLADSGTPTPRQPPKSAN